MSHNKAVIVLENLQKSYQQGNSQQELFSQLNLIIERGDFIALRGSSGSGKSTLLNIISGIECPNSGRVILSGQELTKMHEPHRSYLRGQLVGMVFQFFHLLPMLTVQENLLLVLEQQQRKHIKSRSMAWLKRVGMQKFADKYPNQLSGGEQQRVALARALCHEPEILLADEPTGNLDFHTRASILELLAEVHAEFNQTILLVTHSQTVANLAMKQMRLHEGKLEQVNS